MANIEKEFQNVLKPFIDLSEANPEELKKMIEPFINNINIVKDFLLQIRKELNEEIRYHEEFVKLESQNSEIKELTQKEIELISLLKKEILLLDSCFLFFDRFEDVLISSDKKEKLQDEINILVETLRMATKYPVYILDDGTLYE